MESSSIRIERLLDRERENTRRWLRCSMNTLIDPLVDELFHKLKTELSTSLVVVDNRDLTDERAILPQTSSSQSLILNDKQVNGKVKHREIGNYQQQVNGLPENTRIEPIVQSVLHSHHHIMPHHQLTNMFNVETVMQENRPTTSYNQSQQLHPPLNGSSTLNENSAPIHDLEDDDCDCPQCMNIKLEYNDEDDEENGLLIEDSEDDSSGDRPAKIARIDAQDNIAINKEHTMVITISLKCNQCSETFLDKDQLNDHLLRVHSVRRCRCAVKNCNQTFFNQHLLGEHLRECHPHTREWQCDKCGRNYPKYSLLSSHTINYHHEGQFHCSFGGCLFGGDNRAKVYNHYKQVHQSTEYVCDFQGCGQKFKHETNLRSHERAHLGIAPYRCKWPNCGYANWARSNTVNHIRQVHFQGRRSRDMVGQSQTKDFLEVLHELL